MIVKCLLLPNLRLTHNYSFLILFVLVCVCSLPPSPFKSLSRVFSLKSQTFGLISKFDCVSINVRIDPCLQMAEEISKPLTAANKVTMVSNGGSEVGAAKLTGEVLDIMTRLPAAVEKLTGVDISLVR